MDSKQQITQLLTPIKLGDLELKNRVVLAALTRMRCDLKTGVPNDLHVKYYTQRANAGLILTECSPISNRSNAFPGAAGIYNQDQVEGWKRVVDSVHDAGGKICMQIWHSGRATHSALQNGLEPWAPSAVQLRSLNSYLKKDHEVPHAMTIEEINEIKEQFRQGALNAKQAGFDALQLHGAHGYLVDQFLKDNVNKRTDEYGGSVENRSRFCLEVIDILIEVFGAKYVGIKLTPVGRFGDVCDSDPTALYTYLIQQLENRGVGFIELKDDDDEENFYGLGHPSSKSQVADVYETFNKYFTGIIMANNQFTPEKAEKYIKEGKCQMVSFGKLYIPNPDLVDRIRNGYPLDLSQDFSTYYSGGERGYSDYPTYEEEVSKKLAETKV